MLLNETTNSASDDPVIIVQYSGCSRSIPPGGILFRARLTSQGGDSPIQCLILVYSISVTARRLVEGGILSHSRLTSQRGILAK